MPTSPDTTAPPYLTLRDVRRVCRNRTGKQINRSTVYRWCLYGKLQSIKVVGKILVKPKDLEEFLKARPVCEQEARQSNSRRGEVAARRIRNRKSNQRSRR